MCAVARELLGVGDIKAIVNDQPILLRKIASKLEIINSDKEDD